MLKAEDALATYNAARHDPSLQADMSQLTNDKGRLEMIQQWSENLGPVSPEMNEPRF